MLASLVTLNELKTYIQIKDTNTAYDAELKQLARVATKSLETFTRRSFEAAEYTEYFGTRNSVTYMYDVSGDYSNAEGILQDAQVQKFNLKGYPVDLEEDFLVYYDPNRVFGDDTLVPDTDYFLNAAGNTLFLMRGTVESPRAIKIVYTGGYTTALDGSDLIINGAPEDLKLACITQVVFFFSKLTESNVGVKGSKKHSPEYIQNEQMLCPEAQALAFPYRKNLVGRR